MTNPNPSNIMDRSENDKVSILGSERFANTRSKRRKRDINSSNMMCSEHDNTHKCTMIIMLTTHHFKLI